MRPGLRSVLASIVLLGVAVPGVAAAAAYRDELTFLGRTRFLFREYALVVPVDVKRQLLPGEVFIEIKAWGAWNGSWRPYIYEPITVGGALADDLNGIIARYRQIKGESNLDVRKASDNAFVLNYDKGRTRFDMQTQGFVPRVTLDNPEGHLALGVADGRLDVNRHEVAGRVVSACTSRTSSSDRRATRDLRRGRRVYPAGGSSRGLATPGFMPGKNRGGGAMNNAIGRVTSILSNLVSLVQRSLPTSRRTTCARTD